MEQYISAETNTFGNRVCCSTTIAVIDHWKWPVLKRVSKVNTDKRVRVTLREGNDKGVNDVRETEREVRLTSAVRKNILRKALVLVSLRENGERPGCFEEGSASPRPLSLPKVISAGNLSLWRESRRHFRTERNKESVGPDSRER